MTNGDKIRSMTDEELVDNFYWKNKEETMTLELKVDEMFNEYLIDRREHMGGILYWFMFPNGYGASVVKHEMSYGSEDDLWELGVLAEINGKHYLCYTTPITNDVIGDLTDQSVNHIMHQIFELKGEKNE